MSFPSDRAGIEIEVTRLLKVFPALTPVRGKRPYRKNWQHEKPLSQYELVDELYRGKATGLGARAGRVSGGLLFVDFDGHSALAKYLELSSGVEPPKTVAWTSGKPGRFQIAFRMPKDEWKAIATKKIPTGH